MLLYVFVKLLSVSFYCRTADRSRTYDTQIGLFKLAVSATFATHFKKYVALPTELPPHKEPGAGLEPATSALTEQKNLAVCLFKTRHNYTRSNQLSYPGM